MNTPCRCRRCGIRKTLAKPPEQYDRPSYAACPKCGQQLTVDRYRASGREARRWNCDCGGYPWPGPHRRGSLFCDYGEAGRIGFAFPGRPEAEFIEWEKFR